jgi:imidazolonepropionase
VPLSRLDNIAQLATCRAAGGQGQVHPIDDAALVWEDGRIVWVGRRDELPPAYRAAERLDAGGGLVIPGLVDCHTHLAFGGWRADEFVQRIEGRSYLDIARAGGGIARTVRLTREAGEDALHRRARGFLDDMLALGVTTVECKSGYGLDREHELALLRVYRRLAEAGPSRIVPTFLGAHVVPAEYRDDREGYVRLLVEELIPEVGRLGLAACCDVFVEESAFSVDDAPGSCAPVGPRDWRPRCTPTSSAPAAAPSWRRRWGPCRRITWSTSLTGGSRRWPGRAWWR